MSKLTALAVLVLVLAVAVVARPAVADAPPRQPLSDPEFDEFFRALTERSLKTFDDNVRKVEEAAASARETRVSLRSAALTTAGASTAAEIAQAAISTSVAGADAGVTVSPLPLFGYPDAALQPSLTLAALKGNVTRFQVGVSHRSPEAAGLQLGSCRLDRDAATEARRKIEDLLEEYRAACRALEAIERDTVALPVRDAERRDILASAAEVCGRSRLELPGTLGTGVLQLPQFYKKLREIYEANAEANAPNAVAVQPALGVLIGHNAAFTALKYEGPAIDCTSDQEFDAALLREIWERPRVRLGASIRAELFPRAYGFNPDAPDKELPDGRVSDLEARGEVAYTRGRFEVVAGIGYGRSRAAIAEDLVAYVSPAASIAVTVASLSGQPLYQANGKVNTIDGKLPPRLVLGLDAQLQYAIDPPAFQRSDIQKAAFTGYADFRFSEKLTFRLGLPIAAELATRKSSTTSEILKRDRQWTLPVFLATVLKL